MAANARIQDENGHVYFADVWNISLEQSGPFSDIYIKLNGIVREHGQGTSSVPKILKAKKVIHNYPATIVLWEDGTKTVVKCDWHDTYNPTTGLAMCYMKKALGNSSRAFNDALREGEKKDD